MVYKIGIVAGYIVNDYKQNPFTHKHSLKNHYYFATSGYEAIYNGKFQNS
jgi:hypothetical protein